MISALTIARAIAHGSINYYQVSYTILHDSETLKKSLPQGSTIIAPNGVAEGYYAVVKNPQMVDILAEYSEKWDNDRNPLDIIAFDNDGNSAFYFALV